MVKMTPTAVKKVKEVMEAQDPKPAALRVGVRGGGCSGFSYSLQFESEGVAGPMDKLFNFEDLIVLVDNISGMYLDGCEIDYVETLEASGFKFNNPNVKSTCGCGSSFSA
jgi:iron-sulfur cluster assembly accessory protein